MILTFFWDIGDAIGVLFFAFLFVAWTYLVVSYRIKKWFTKKYPKEGTNKTPADFKRNEIYKMAVASRSHVTKPYYVIIISTGPDFIATYIPHRDSFRIKYPSPEWDYHIPRMTYVKTSNENDPLLHNQKLD